MTKIDFDMTDLDIFVRNALRDEGHILKADKIHSFFGNIRHSIAVYSSQHVDEVPARISYNALKRLWGAINQTVPSIGLIRANVLSLPHAAKFHLMRRATSILTDHFADDFSENIFDDWVRSANPPELIRILKILISEGGMIVNGRKGRKSQQIFEPMIMGVIRGTGIGLGQGGRPILSARDELVMHLAVDWLNATGKAPQQGRNDKKGFAGLVHIIFDLLEIKSTRKSDSTDEANGAGQALRRYWSAITTRSGTTTGKRHPAQRPKRPSTSRNRITKD